MNLFSQNSFSFVRELPMACMIILEGNYGGIK